MYFFACVCVFFFFNQKTADEMRISDWSSDVCSSDLPRRLLEQARQLHDQGRGRVRGRGEDRSDPPASKFDPAEFDMPADPPPSAAGRARGAADAAQAHSFFSRLDTRSEERRGGKEFCSTCRSRVSPDH